MTDIIAYYETLLQEDINVGVGTAEKRNPGGGTLIGTQVGIHTFAINQAAVVAPWTVGEVASLTTESLTVTVQGAVRGDFVLVSIETPLSGLILWAEVTVASTVVVRVFNPTTEAITISSEHDVRILVLKSR